MGKFLCRFCKKPMESSEMVQFYTGNNILDVCCTNCAKTNSIEPIKEGDVQGMIDNKIHQAENIENNAITLKDLLENLHYKPLDESIKVRVKDDLYNITSITESSKDGLIIETEKCKTEHDINLEVTKDQAIDLYNILHNFVQVSDAFTSGFKTAKQILNLLDKYIED